MKKLLFIGFLATSLGCVHLQPVGPMADIMGSKKPDTSPAPNVKVKPADDAATKPMLPAAPPPVPPALMVTPGEITETNAADSIRRLLGELEADRKSAEAMPRYAEVSVIKK